MPFDQQAAVAVAADAARAFTEGLRGIVLKASAEADSHSQRVAEEHQRLEADRKVLEQERQRLEADVQGLADERSRLAAERASLDAEWANLEKDRVGLEELRRGFNGERVNLNRDRAVLAQERAMFERQQAEFVKAREEFCKERVDFEEAKELAAQKQPARQAANAAVEESSEMVVLNLGGEANVTVLLSTLLQCPECRFTSSFSRPWELPRDPEGRIFVDFKPALFMPLLEHLRMRRIEEPGDRTPPPKIDSPELEGQFNKMLQHYGLRDWVYRTGVPLQPRPEVQPPISSGAQGPGPAALQRALASPSKPLQAARLPQPIIGDRLQDAAQKVGEAEAKVQETLLAAAPLIGEGADDAEVGTLKGASERTLEAEKLAAIACAEAKKVVLLRQKDDEAAKGSPSYKVELSKLQERVTAAQHELGKQRKVAVQGEKLWKGKLALQHQEAMVRQLEAQVEAASRGGQGPGVPVALGAATALLARTEAALADAQRGEAQAQGFLAKLVARTARCKERLVTARQPSATPQQEVAQRLADAERAVRTTAIQAAPLAVGASVELSVEVAQEICEKVGKAWEDANAKLEEVRLFLIERQKHLGGQALGHFMPRINGMKAELAKAKAAKTGYEHRLVATMITQEAAEVVRDVEAEVEKVREVAVPVVEERGRCFVVAGMARLVAEALDEHLQHSGLTRDSLFQSMGIGATRDKATMEEFASFLAKVPAMCSCPNLAFSAEQRAAIFKLLDKDKDGTINKADFLSMFCDRYVCTKDTIITKDAKLVAGQSLGKLQKDDIVEVSGDTQCDASGILRAQVTALRTGTVGWVTIRGNAGNHFLRVLTPYQDFVKSFDESASKAQAAIAKATEFHASKSSDIQDCAQGPLVEARAELGKIRPKIATIQAKLVHLKKRVEDFKREYAKRDEFERKKQEEKIERKASTVEGAPGSEPT